MGEIKGARLSKGWVHIVPLSSNSPARGGIMRCIRRNDNLPSKHLLPNHILAPGGFAERGHPDRRMAGELCLSRPYMVSTEASESVAGLMLLMVERLRQIKPN